MNTAAVINKATVQYMNTAAVTNNAAVQYMNTAAVTKFDISAFYIISYTAGHSRFTYLCTCRNV